MTCVLDSCNQGRIPCPDPAVCCGRSRRVQEHELRRQCAASGQMDSRQIAAHQRAGELDGIGYEGADAARVTGTAPPIVTDELREVREPWSGEAKLLIAAVVLTWLTVMALSVADPRDLSTLWPRLVAAVSL